MIETPPNLDTNFFSGFATRSPDERLSLARKNRSAEFILLNEISVLNKCVYFLSDFENREYLFYTDNFNNLKGFNPKTINVEWGSDYPPLLTDRSSALRYISLLSKIIARLSLTELSELQCICCGYYIHDRADLNFRCLYSSGSIFITDQSKLKLSFDGLSNVMSLMTSEIGYWIRFSAAGKVFHWHSRTNKLVEKDILSLREKEIANLWRLGFSIPEIAAKLYISNFTVKNQLANARGKLLARDNTALVQLCLRTGILSSDF